MNFNFYFVVILFVAMFLVIKQYKNKKVFVCCASGMRSRLAEAILREHGFKNVVNAGPWKNTLV